MPDVSKFAHLVRPTMLSGLCVMVPVPFLDEVLLRRVRKGMIHGILRKRGIELDPAVIRPVYTGLSGGCLEKVFGLVFKGVTTILRKLLRTVLFFLAIRASAVAMMETLLIGRTLDRVLAGETPANLALTKEEAQRIRTAFEEALSGSDRRILVRSMKAGWRHIGGIRHLGKALAGRFRKGGEGEEIRTEDLDAEELAAVEQGSADLERELEKREVRTFLADFDGRFDAALARLRSSLEAGSDPN